MEHKKLSRIFKALSNEQRLSLFKKIVEWQSDCVAPDKDLGCGGIEKAFTKACGCMQLSRSTVSHHIKELENAGLIICTRKGKAVSIRVNDETVSLVKNFID